MITKYIQAFVKKKIDVISDPNINKNQHCLHLVVTIVRLY